MENRFTDQMGNTIHLHGKPGRLISLVPSQTELLFDLGLDEEIVGITDYCIHPADKCRGKTTVGGPKSVDFARIDELRPDLIIANKEENNREEIEKLQGMYPLWMSDITTLDDALAMIEGVGTLVGRADEALRIAGRIRDTITPVDDAGITVAYFIWQNPYMVAGGTTFIDEMIGRCGLTNVFAPLPRYPAVTEEQIREARPEVMLLCSEPYLFTDKHVDKFQETFPFARAVVVDGEIFSWYGSRLQYAGDYFRSLRRTLADMIGEEKSRK
jgi:ABC-type Fe3+-hydroxamate transport system substrate-binding protein